MEEKTITFEYDVTSEDVLNIVERLLSEFGVKHEFDGEGTITYWVEKKNE